MVLRLQSIELYLVINSTELGIIILTDRNSLS